MDMEFTTGSTGGDMKGNGEKIKCMGKGCTLGQMEEFTEVLIRTTKKTGMGCTDALMVEFTKGTGNKESSMGLALTQARQGKLRKECGRTERE